MSLYPKLLIALALGLTACDPALKSDEAPGATTPVQVQPAFETPPAALDQKKLDRMKRNIDYFIKSAPYLALVREDAIERVAVSADEIGQMQRLEYHLSVLETFKGDDQPKITYTLDMEMSALDDVPAVNAEPYIISLCYVDGTYIAQEVGFSVNAYPELIAHAREAAKLAKHSDDGYADCEF